MLEKIKEIAADSLGAERKYNDSRNIFQRRSRSRFP